MSTEPATPSPEADLSIDWRLALLLIRQAMVSEDAALDDARAILSFLVSANSEPQECSSLSSAEETWISEAVIALTYTPIDPARLYRWPGHSGLTLDSEQARDAALRVLSQMQAKSIPTPAASSSSGEAQRVGSVPLSVLEQLRHHWQDEANNPRWLAFTAADALLECAADLQRAMPPAASGEAQDPPEADPFAAVKALPEWQALVRQLEEPSRRSVIDYLAGRFDNKEAITSAARCLVSAVEPTPAGGEGTDR